MACGSELNDKVHAGIPKYVTFLPLNPLFVLMRLLYPCHILESRRQMAVI